jgi:ABC-2 type transport system permease protein
MRKEISDHFASRRIMILVSLIAVAGVSAIYVAGMTIRDTVAFAEDGAEFVFLRLFTTSGANLPPFTSFLGFLGPLVGLAVGFDAVNGERARGTLSRILSNPIHRDAVLNGKFLAGVFAVSIMLLSLTLLVAGMGLQLIGVPPTSEEMARILAYTTLTIVYVSFWLAVSILFSVYFRQASTSALAGIAVWLFASVFMPLIAGMAADAAVPLQENPTALEILAHERIRQGISRISPTALYYEAAASILSPHVRSLGLVLIEQIEGAVAGPLPLVQSILNIWPHATGLVAGTLVCFAVAYVGFMRQEIRAG